MTVRNVVRSVVRPVVQSIIGAATGEGQSPPDPDFPSDVPPNSPYAQSSNWDGTQRQNLGTNEWDPGTFDRSYSCWFKTSTAAKGGIFGKSDGGSNALQWFFEVQSDGSIMGAFDPGPGTGDGDIVGAAIDDGQWHHVAMVCDRSSGHELFLDGVSQGTFNSTSSQNASNSNPLWIGYSNRSFSGTYYTGQISDCRIHTQLYTADNIAFLRYLGGTDPGTPIGHWTLNGNYNNTGSRP